MQQTGLAAGAQMWFDCGSSLWHRGNRMFLFNKKCFASMSFSNQSAQSCLTDAGEFWLCPVTVKEKKDDRLRGRRSRRTINASDSDREGSFLVPSSL